MPPKATPCAAVNRLVRNDFDVQFTDLGTSKNSTKPVIFHPETYRGPYKLVFVW